MQRTRVLKTSTILLLALAPFLFGACGLLFTHGPPAGHETMVHFTCSESTTGPVLDIVWGSLNLVAALVIAGNPDQYKNPGQATASGVVWAVISGISAAVGFDRVKKCVTAKRQLAERQAHAPSGAGESAGVQTVLIMSGGDTLTVGEHTQLVAKAFDSSGAVLLGKSFKWSSSNDAIASVSDAGLVTAHAAGTVVIAANADNVVGTASVVVMSAR